MNSLSKHESQAFHNMVARYVDIDSQVIDQVCAIGRIQQLSKGDFLLHMGEVARKIYFVLEGILISQYPSGEGQVHIKNFFLPGNMAGSKVSLLKSTPSKFSIQCLEDAKIIAFDFAKYRDLVFSTPDLMNFYIKYLEDKWIIENEKRQMAFATQSATERYLTFLKDYPDLENRVSQHQIALFLGVTPTQLSRIRKDLKKN
ncbi:Crp/Fnr family transcriptional regulator [Reichenbachiella sp.]|uniref:Crp/Fnr family transcriptional regulator n=1 Tax=Reichenbachiella sp. TaxID=2184521 RepID=UPI003BB1076F